MRDKGDNGKLLLENPPLERAVLGTMISDTNFFWAMKDRARPELFTVTIHRRICGILHLLAEEGRDLNVPAVISRLAVDRDNSTFSPEGYLATLVADEASAEQAPDFLRDLEDMWARREMAKLGSELIRQSTADTGMDAMARLEDAQSKMESLGDPMGTSVRHIAQVAQVMMDRVAAASEAEKTVGLAPGLKAVQDLTGALMPGRVYTLAGPPGSGKSALAQQIAKHVAGTDPALFISIEMEDEEIAERDLAGTTGITTDKIERAALNFDEVDLLYEEVAKLSKSKLYVDSTSNATVARIRAKAMRMKRLKGLSLLVIDHLLYIERPDRRMGEFEGIRANMQALKKLAKDLGIPILLLTQLKKEFGEGPWQQMRRPNVNDLYGGSAPEQESDIVIFVHREEYLLGRKEPAKDAKDREDWQTKMDEVKGKAELVLAKRRGGAGFGVRTLWFEGPRLRFYDQAPRTSDRVTSRDLVAQMTDEDMEAIANM